MKELVRIVLVGDCRFFSLFPLPPFLFPPLLLFSLDDLEVVLCMEKEVEYRWDEREKKKVKVKEDEGNVCERERACVGGRGGRE